MIKFVCFAIVLFFMRESFGQEIIMATSEDIQEFDRILEKTPLPPDLERQRQREEEKGSVEGSQRSKKNLRGSRTKFERGIRSGGKAGDRPARPPRETAFPVPPGAQPPGVVGRPDQLPPPVNRRPPPAPPKNPPASP